VSVGESIIRGREIDSDGTARRGAVREQSRDRRRLDAVAIKERAIEIGPTFANAPPRL